jgi:inorganic pyrophosphatase
MAQAVNVVLTEPEYKPFWQSIPGFVKLQGKLATEITFIIKNAPKTIRRKTGSAEDKDAARKALCKAALIIAGAVASHAHDVGDHQLLVRVDTNPTLLMSGRGQDTHSKCADILDAATANLAALADFDVTQADLNHLEQLLEEYEELLPQPQVAIGSAKGAGQAMDAALDRIDGILNNGLDNLMLKFEDTQPDFYRDYTNARIIIDRPGGHSNGDSPTPPPAPPAPPAK